MRDEFSDHHQAIKLKLAGRSVEYICQALGRSREWFHTWWRRYQDTRRAHLTVYAQGRIAKRWPYPFVKP